MNEVIDYLPNKTKPIPVIAQTEQKTDLVNHSPLDLPPEVFNDALDRRQINRQKLLSWIKSNLTEDVDYGSITRRNGQKMKPSLWKAGAEKITGMLGVFVTFPSLAETEKAVLSGTKLTTIMVRCEILDSRGQLLANGAGGRSLAQDNNDFNKAIKMAEKSAHIDAVLRLAGLSEIFSQDLEDKPIPLNEQTEKNVISDTQIKRIQERIDELELDEQRVNRWIQKAWKVSSFKELPTEYYKVLLTKLTEWSAIQSAA